MSASTTAISDSCGVVLKSSVSETPRLDGGEETGRSESGWRNKVDFGQDLHATSENI